MSKANPKPGEMPVKGKMLSSQANARIFESFPFNDYEISEPAFSEDEKQLFSALLAFVQRKTTFSRESKAISKQLPAQFFGDLSQTLLRDIDIEGLSRRIPTEQEAASLQAMLEIALSGIEFAKNREGIARNVLDKSIGFGPLSEMMRDPTLEEIMINSEDKVFVFHKDFGMCKANTAFSNREEFLDLISRIANTVGRKFDSYNTFLDARLPDGSRANATYPTITPVSPTLTIRKFSQIPLSIIDLISNRTMNSELAAFLWAMVEGMRIEPMNLIVAGGTGCGKTTTLNALSTFIRANERIITIEDTLELDLGSRENWVQMESRPKTRDEIDVTMDDLLKNSLRMRPDRIIVGEVRGPE
ncbi:MAG: ATPase, T2SS/T4P/T4SS family, partial [archaeon]